MTVREMQTPASLSVAAVMAAIEIIDEVEGVSRKPGTAAPMFFELEFAPSVGELSASHGVASQLLNSGIGIKLSVHWPFKGTTRWALKTEATRVVNAGL